jgi:hypothetical protein
MLDLLKASLAKDKNKRTGLHDLDPGLHSAITGGDGCPASWDRTKEESSNGGEPAWDIDAVDWS